MRFSLTFAGTRIPGRVNGTYGQPSLASAEKGERIFEEALTRLLQFVEEFQNRPTRERVDHHSEPPTSPLPEI